MKRNIATIALFLFLTVNTFSSPPQPPDKGDLAQAIKECEASKGDNGRPDRQAMATCMEAKGFSKPPEKNGGGPPPRDSCLFGKGSEISIMLMFVTRVA